MVDSKVDGQINTLNHIYPHIAKVSGNTSAEETKAIYDEWSSTYDEVIDKYGYLADKESVRLFSELLEKNNFDKNAYILDVGIGTGKVGIQLHNKGYNNIDGLDISTEMLKIAEQKKLYKKLFCAAVDEQNTGIPDNTYDGQISVGCITVGHAKADALYELARIAKPGGLISFTLRTFVWEDGAYGYKKVINELVEKGVWDIVSAKKIDYNISEHIKDTDISLRYYYLVTCQKKK